MPHLLAGLASVAALLTLAVFARHTRNVHRAIDAELARMHPERAQPIPALAEQDIARQGRALAAEVERFLTDRSV